MRQALTKVLVGVVLAAVPAMGCLRETGTPSDTRLTEALKDNATKPGEGSSATPEEIKNKKCGTYREQLAKAQADDLQEEARLDAYMKLYSDLKAKNEFLENALAKNPDLQFQNESEVPRNRDECVTALADVRNAYYAFVSDIATLLVVKDVSDKPAPRLDFKKFKDAVVVLNPDDRESILQQVDAADRKIKNAKANP